jgi:hypothetical protein
MMLSRLQHLFVTSLVSTCIFHDFMRTFSSILEVHFRPFCTFIFEDIVRTFLRTLYVHLCSPLYPQKRIPEFMYI